MKNFTLLVAALMMGTTAWAQQVKSPSEVRAQLFFFARLKTKAHLVGLARKASKLQATTNDNATKKMLPAKETEYEYVDGAWEASSVYTYTYDANGRITRQDEEYDGTINRTENEWSAYGYNTLQVTSSSEDGVTFTNSEKRVQIYDEKVPSLCIQKDKYVWSDDEWTAITDAYKRQVTRDADGNVTSVVVSVPYNGVYEATRRMTNTVDPQTKLITATKMEVLGYNADYTGFEWQTNYELTDIKWAKTNGQVVTEYDEWLDGEENLLASAKILLPADEDERAATGQINITYDGNGGYVTKVSYDDNSALETMTKTMGDNGSYSIVDYYLADDNEDGVLNEEDTPEYYKTVVEYDNYGNLTLEEEYMSEDGEEWELQDGTKQDYTYDPEHSGTILQTVYSAYDYEEEAYVPSIKIVTEELTPAGIQAISIGDAAVRFYNLQGMEQAGDFNSLPAGIYVVKSAEKATKVVKK